MPTDQIVIITNVSEAPVLPLTTKEPEQLGMNDVLMLISPYPNTRYFDTPAEVWTNLWIAVFAVVLAVICICRMNVLTNRHKLVVRIRYLLLFCGSVSTAMSPWAFPDNPRLGGFILLVTLVVHMLLGAAEWKHGPPRYTESNWGDLPEPERACDEQFCNHCRSMGTNPDALWCRIKRCLYVVAYILRGDRQRDFQSGVEGRAP